MEQLTPFNDSDSERKLDPDEAQARGAVKKPTVPADTLDVSEQTPLIVRNKDFYFEDAIFRVENELFCIPRQYVIQESDILRDKIDAPDPMSSRGRIDDDPVVLGGIQVNDFQIFLKMLYHSNLDCEENFTYDDWTVILGLDKYFKFHHLRDRAISELKLFMPYKEPASYVELGRKYGAAELELEGLKAMIRREAPMGEREAKSDLIGISDTLKIAAIRERVGTLDRFRPVFTERAHSTIDFTQKLKDVFSL